MKRYKGKFKKTVEDDYAMINQSKTNTIDTMQDSKKTSDTIGSEIGNKCPVCRKGSMTEADGCHTCTNCGAHLKCEL